MPRGRTHFALVATGEGTSTDAYRQARLAQLGLPPAATDFLVARVQGWSQLLRALQP